MRKKRKYKTTGKYNYSVLKESRNYWRHIAEQNSKETEENLKRIAFLEREQSILISHRETMLHAQVLFRKQVAELQLKLRINTEGILPLLEEVI